MSRSGLPQPITETRPKYRITDKQRATCLKMLDYDYRLIVVRGVYSQAWFAHEDEVVEAIGPGSVITMYLAGLLDLEETIRGVVGVYALSNAGMKLAADQVKTGLRIVRPA